MVAGGVQALGNGARVLLGLPGFTVQSLEDRWILSRFNRVAKEINDALEAYRFHEAAHVVYHFFWGEYCDWYIELMKPRLMSDNRELARAAYANVVGIFEARCECCRRSCRSSPRSCGTRCTTAIRRRKSIALAAYPRSDDVADRHCGRNRDGDPAGPNRRGPQYPNRAEGRSQAEAADRNFCRCGSSFAGSNATEVRLELLADVDGVGFVDGSLAKVAGARSTSRFDVRVVYERKIDVATERERLTKEVAKLTGELQRGTGQLSNEAFLAKAPAKVVDGLKKRKAEVEVLMEKAKAALDELDTVPQ